MKTLQSILDDLNKNGNEAVDAEIEFVKQNFLPSEEEIALEAPIWNRISKIACLWTDMVGSSKIDYNNHPKTATGIYEAFTGTLVDTFRMFNAGFYDIKGDGGFALFDGENSAVRAFLAGETFRTSIARNLRSKVEEKTKGKVTLVTRASISFGNVAVKRIGVRGRYNNNLVWLDSTINQGAKLIEKASGQEGQEEIIVTPSAYDKLDHEKIRYSCECGGRSSPLWKKIETPELDGIGIPEAYLLKSLWCKKHGSDYFKQIAEDNDISLESE